MTLDRVTSFSRIKTYKIHVTVKVLGGISFHIRAENRKLLKDTLAFFVVSCV